ncbi:MAG: AIR carboxylase family protein, partial [Burkholderiaceae bacterium]
MSTPVSPPEPSERPWVGVVMGSSSDWDTLQHATAILQEFGVAYEARVLSAHRMPDDMFAYAEAA